MKKNVILIIASAVAFILVFLLFSSKFKSPENAMTPPGPSAENEEILQAFNNSIGENTAYQLQFPRSGAYHNPFIRNDIDRDGEREVLVFYSTDASEPTVRLNVLDKQGEEWVSVLDTEGYGSGVDSIRFDDLNRDGKSEIILGWDLLNDNSIKRLTVNQFNIDEHAHLQLDCLMDQQYNDMGVEDMDGDGKDDLLVIWGDNSAKAPNTYVSLFKMNNDGTITTVGKRAALDSNVSGYTSLKFQRKKNECLAFLDATKGEHGMITEIIWWDKAAEKLCAPMTENDSLTNTKTYRPFRIPSWDVDGDSRIDIPLAMEQKYQIPQTEQNLMTQLPVICWYSPGVSGENIAFSPAVYTYVNKVGRYYLRVPKEYSSKVVAVRDNTGVLTLKTAGGGNKPLFSIVAKPKDRMRKADTYSFRTDHGSMVAYGTLTSAGKQYGMSNKEIEKNIVFY